MRPLIRVSPWGGYCSSGAIIELSRADSGIELVVRFPHRIFYLRRRSTSLIEDKPHLPRWVVDWIRT
jgi:hypothetical protein